MNEATPAAANPFELLRSLTADALQERLNALQDEADAIRVLLRSARARERRRQAQQEHGAHATAAAG
jgi:hypothetical protein